MLMTTLVIKVACLMSLNKQNPESNSAVRSEVPAMVVHQQVDSYL